MKKILLKCYYIVLKIRGMLTVNINKMLSILIKPPLVHTTDETLQKIVHERYSVSRFGDGEFSLMNGGKLLFQPYNNELSLRLREILKSQKNNHIVCVPNIFDNTDWCTEKSKNYWVKYLNENRKKIYKLLEIKKEYYDTQVTRLYIDHKDKSKAENRFNTFKKLWDNRKVVIVEGEQSRLGIGNNLFDNVASIERILCPAKDAFANYNEIYNEVKEQDHSKLILIALGPTPTILAYDLALDGYQAIDISHIDIEYEWFLQKVEEKCPVKNKYIGEIPNGSIVEDINDKKYESEIFKKVG